MDPLAIYCNAIWQDAQYSYRRIDKPNSREELASFARRLHTTPRLVYSALAKKWLACGPVN
jgi:hypothetical protein